MISIVHIPGKQKNSILSDLINTLKTTYYFETSRIFMFDDDKDYAAVIDAEANNEDMYTDNTMTIDLTNPTKNYVFNLALTKRQIILCEKDDLTYEDKTYTHLVKGMEKELYLPVFSQSIYSDEIIGCIYLGTHKVNKFGFSDIEQDSFQHIYTDISMSFNTLYEGYITRRRFFLSIHTLVEIYRSQYRYINHPYNVAYWSLSIARELKLDEQQQYFLYIAALLHDAGKLMIPKEIVNKQGKLTDEEYAIMKMHPVFGSNIVYTLKNGLDILDNLDSIIQCHHENYDGSGYPNGIAGEDIPLFSRIIAVADAADAMLSERSYKPPKPLESVINEFIENRGTQFDPEIADIMISILIKQKSNIESVLGPISWGTLIVKTASQIRYFQGNLIQRLSGYEFCSDEMDFNKALEMTDIIQCAFVVEKGEKLYEYSLKVKKICKNSLYISDIKIKPSSQYFSMIWYLPGEIRTKELNLDITIKKIGGNLITFNLAPEQPSLLQINETCSLKISFDDGEIIELSGTIVECYENECYTYYVFSFANISESTRDKIFMHIFKRQIEFRKILWKAGGR